MTVVVRRLFSSEDALQIWLQSLSTLIGSSTSTPSTSCSSSSLSAPFTASLPSSATQGNNNNNNNNKNNSSSSSCTDIDSTSSSSSSLQSTVNSCHLGADIDLQFDKDSCTSDIHSVKLVPNCRENSVRTIRDPVIAISAVSSVTTSRPELMAPNIDLHSSTDSLLLTTGRALDTFPRDHVSNSTPLLLSSSLTETTSIPAYVAAEDAVYASSSLSTAYNALPLVLPIAKSKRGRTAQIPVQCFSLDNGQVRFDLALCLSLSLYFSLALSISLSLGLSLFIYIYLSLCLPLSISLFLPPIISVPYSSLTSHSLIFIIFLLSYSRFWSGSLLLMLLPHLWAAQHLTFVFVSVLFERIRRWQGSHSWLC